MKDYLRTNYLWIVLSILINNTSNFTSVTSQGSAEWRSVCGLFVAVDVMATADKCGSIPKIMPMRSSVTWAGSVCCILVTSRFARQAFMIQIFTFVAALSFRAVEFFPNKPVKKKTAVQIADGCCEQGRVDVSWNNTLNQHASYVYQRSACSVTHLCSVSPGKKVHEIRVFACAADFCHCVPKGNSSLGGESRRRRWVIRLDSEIQLPWSTHDTQCLAAFFFFSNAKFHLSNSLTASLSRLLYLTWHAR